MNSLQNLVWEFVKENKKVRKKKQDLDQESDQEKKGKKERKHALDQESDQEIKKKLSFFLEHFLGRKRVFFLFLVFFHKFSSSGVHLFFVFTLSKFVILQRNLGEKIESPETDERLMGKKS